MVRVHGEFFADIDPGGSHRDGAASKSMTTNVEEIADK